MPPLAIPWNPEAVLGIGQVLSGSTCVAETKKGSRCAKPIAVENRQRASKQLLQMSRLDTSASGVIDTLEPLARLLVCNGWNHKDQVREVVTKWREHIQTFQAAVAAQGGDGPRLDQVGPDQEPLQVKDPIKVDPALLQQTIQYQPTAKLHFHETKAAQQDVEIAQQDAAACRRGLAIALRDLDAARREIASALQNLDMARQEMTSALQDVKSARQDAMNALREAKMARQEVHTLRIEATRDLAARNALVQRVTALTATRGGGETLAPTPNTPRHDLAASSTRRPSNDLQERDAADTNRISITAEDCGICFIRLGSSRTIRCSGARCRRLFHDECIGPWLQLKRKCPIW